eukprot:gene15871-21518_t
MWQRLIFIAYLLGISLLLFAKNGSSLRIYVGVNKLSNVHYHSSSLVHNKAIQWQLKATPSEPDLQSIKGMKGYYVRPSRAIEKGGGFYVPGLEGERIRILAAITFIFLLLFNHSGLQNESFSLVVTEVVTIICSVVLFLQGIQLNRPDSNNVNKSNEKSISIWKSSEFPFNDVLISIATALFQNIPQLSNVAIINNDMSNQIKENNILFQLGDDDDYLKYPKLFESSVLIEKINEMQGKFLQNQIEIIEATSGNSVETLLLIDSRQWLWILMINKSLVPQEINKSLIQSLIALPFQSK